MMDPKIQHTLERHTITFQENNRVFPHRTPSDLPPLCETDATFSPWLSLKASFQGTTVIETDDGGRFSIDREAYLMLNKDHRYTIDATCSQPSDLFCVFFPMAWAADILHSTTNPPQHLLAEPAPKQPQTVHFFEHRYHHNALVTPHLQQMRTRLRDNPDDEGWLEEKLRLLLLDLLQTQTNIYHQIEQMPAARHATRIELYERLHRVQDYLHATLHQPLTLNDMAAIAHFSPYHFLRAFKQRFGQTPHAYLTQLRLEKAQTLLCQTDKPITEICLAVGFQSLSSFIHRFRRHYGCSPRDFRRQKG